MPDAKSYLTLLVSNKHVFLGGKGNIAFRMHERNQENGPVIGNAFHLNCKDFSPIYMEHPEKEIDLACINISSMLDPVKGVFFKSVPSEMFVDFDDENLIPGTDVYFVGYPAGHVDPAHNLPFLRKGYIASMPKLDFSKQSLIVIDAQVHGGSSGSPVFAKIGKVFKFLGVIAAMMIKQDQVIPIEPTTTLAVQQPLGLGLVIKANKVKELVDFVIGYLKDKPEDFGQMVKFDYIRGPIIHKDK